jgi:hypothetical protein
VLLSEVHVRVQTWRALAADFPPVELLVMICKTNGKEKQKQCMYTYKKAE